VRCSASEIASASSSLTPVFADVRLVERVQRYEVGKVAESVVVRVLHGVKRDAVTSVPRVDRHPPDRLRAVDLGLTEELLDAHPTTQGADGELSGEVTHPEILLPGRRPG
jgi:hypothetical protein